MNRRTVFVDTWAWVAAAVRDDPNHARAVELETVLVRDGVRRITSNFVLSEAVTRLRYDASLSVALALLDAVVEMVAAGWLEVVVVDELVWAEATAWLRRFEDQPFSFVDCTSFAIMAERDLTEALTGDRHFATAGFVALGA